LGHPVYADGFTYYMQSVMLHSIFHDCT